MNLSIAPADDIASQAYRWVLVLGGRELRSAVLSDFEEWLQRSPDHVRHYQLAATYYARMKRLPPIASDQTMEWLERSRRVSRVVVHGEAPISMSEALWRPAGLPLKTSAQPVLRRGAYSPAATASTRTWLAPAVHVAAAVVVFGISGILLSMGNRSWSEYSIDSGTDRHVQLDDGSSMVLSPKFDVRMLMSSSRRQPMTPPVADLLPMSAPSATTGLHE